MIAFHRLFLLGSLDYAGTFCEPVCGSSATQHPICDLSSQPPHPTTSNSPRELVTQSPHNVSLKCFITICKLWKHSFADQADRSGHGSYYSNFTTISDQPIENTFSAHPSSQHHEYASSLRQLPLLCDLPAS